MMDKRCAACKEIKSLDNFRIDKRWNSPRSWCKQCSNQKAAEYQKLHPEKAKASIEKYHRNNKQKLRLRNTKWRKNNPEKSRASSRNWYMRKRNRITECLHSGLYQSFDGKFDRKRIWHILGYSYEELIEHIEKQFREGMNWNNYGKWEIDHIIPKSAFSYQSWDDAEFKACWRLENLQPLWVRENRQKGNKILVA